MLEDFTAALQLRDWYAIAAIGLYVAIAARKRYSPKVLPPIPNGRRSLPPVAVSACTGFVVAYQAGEPVGAALVAAIGAVLAIALPSMGIQGAAKELGKR